MLPTRKAIQPLHYAIMKDDHSLVESLLRGISLVDYREKDGSNLIHVSATYGNACLTKYFIQFGCDINGEDIEKNVPLIHAMTYAGAQRLPVVKLLVEAGARVDLKNKDGEDALNCCMYDNIKEYLICVKVLLDGGADVNSEDPYGETPLFRAAMNCKVEIVDFFLNHMADPNIQNDCQETALYAAVFPLYGFRNKNYSIDVRSKQFSVISSLFNHKADPNIRCKFRSSNTPFLCSLLQCDAKAVRLFLDHGADLNTKDELGQGPVHYAAQNEFVEVLRLLQEKGCNVNERDICGQTAVHEAVRLGLLQNIELLCEHGADINVQDNEGMTPLHVLVKCLKKEVKKSNTYNLEIQMDWLVNAAGANVNALTKTGASILHLAHQSGKRTVENLVMKLLAKLLFLGKPVSAVQMNLIWAKARYRNYFDICMAELSAIKGFIVFNVEPILMSYRRIPRCYVKNVNMRVAFRQINVREKFPVYGSLMLQRYIRELRMQIARMIALRQLWCSVPEIIRVDVVLRKIIDYLSDRDVLLLVCKQNREFIQTVSEKYFSKIGM